MMFFWLPAGTGGGDGGGGGGVLPGITPETFTTAGLFGFGLGTEPCRSPQYSGVHVKLEQRAGLGDFPRFHFFRDGFFNCQIYREDFRKFSTPVNSSTSSIPLKFRTYLAPFWIWFFWLRFWLIPGAIRVPIRAKHKGN